MVPELKIEAILDLIDKREPFEAIDDLRCFHLKIDRYTPMIAAAIHDGHHLPEDRSNQCALSDAERLYEEDPYTKSFIQHCPIVFSGLDSRYYYDLNRMPSEAIYDTAWGKSVWTIPLSDEQKTAALNRYTRCYTVIHHLMRSLVQQFSDRPILVFDIHSYNYKRWEREVPEINVGTSKVDRAVWGAFIERYLNLLAHSFDTFWVAENNTFFGKGAFLQQLMNQHENCLVLATEFKKYFCDELTAEVYLEKVEDTAHKLQTVIDKMLISEL
jgi:hypothetical protein